MPLHLRPSRREPRPLVVVATADGLAYAALDAWELRALGSTHTRSRAGLMLAIGRILLQAKPTVLVRLVPVDVHPPSFFDATLARLAQRARLALVRLAPLTAQALLAGAPSALELRHQYPEVHRVAGYERDAVRLAARALTHLALPPRLYAPRLSARTTPRVASGRLRGASRPRTPHRPPARRSARPAP